MVKPLKAFGVVAGIVTFLFCMSAGITSVLLKEAPEWVHLLGVFYMGMAFFAGPLVIIVALKEPVGVLQSGKQNEVKRTTAKPAARKISGKPAVKSQPEKENGSGRIYVGNLSPEADIEAIKIAFSGFGEIKDIRIIKDRTGKSKGYAFIEMPNTEEAQKAIDSLNGRELAGRALKLNFAKSKPTGDSRRPPRRRPPNKPSDSPSPKREDAQMVDWDA